MKVKDMVFHKKRCKDGERILYLFGLRILSYRKKKIKRAKEYIKSVVEYPMRVYEEYNRLEDEIKKLKKNK